ncbi:hypothetical protein BG005_010474 [Podila minutissima]|nr:hypothetical protein BG005_010474 [Podila minutissima]
MAFSVQDTNELGTPFPADWMVMTIIRSSIQRSTINNTVRSLVTCRWNEHEVELVPDPTAAPEANTSEGSLVRLAVGSEIQVRGLINVRAHFQGQGSRRHRKPVLSMTLDAIRIRFDGDGGDGGRMKMTILVVLVHKVLPPMADRMFLRQVTHSQLRRRRLPHQEEEEAHWVVWTHYFDGYGRLLNDDGSAQERMHTLFTFRQNRASGNAHWLHVLATRNLEERQLNLAVWEEIIFPNPANTSKTDKGPRRGTLQMIFVNRRIPPSHLPEEPNETWPLEPIYIITLDSHGALANAEYIRDGTIDQDDIHPRYLFEQHFNNGARRNIHVVLITQKDETQFEYQVWEEYLAAGALSPIWRPMERHSTAYLTTLS